MKSAPIELHRDALYEQVWRTPISRLASTYGLSDNGLRKICKKLHVPTPGRGYWARRQHGHDVAPVPLPELPEGAPDTHVIHRRPAAPEDEARDEPPATEAAHAPALEVPPITVPSRLRAPHPLVARTREAFKEAFTDQYGRKHPADGLHVIVGPDQVRRALRVLNALLKQATRLGVDMGTEPDRRRAQSYFAIEGERVYVRMTERLRREERPVDPSEPSWARRKWDYFLTGRLRIELVGAHGPGRKRWSDGVRQRLEDQLASVLEGVYAAAQGAKRWRAEIERRERAWEEDQRRKQEAAERKAAEAARRRDLEAQAHGWTQSQTLSAYLDAVEQQADAATLLPDAQEAHEAWMAWAREHARRVNPLSDGLPVASTSRGDSPDASD